MQEIDTRGLSCPLPIIKTKEALDENGEAVVLVSDSGVKENIERFAGDKGYSVSSEKLLDGGYRLRLKQRKR